MTEYDGYLAASWASEARNAADSLCGAIARGERDRAGSLIALLRDLCDDLSGMLPEPTDN